MNEKIAETGFPSWAITRSVSPCFGQFRHYYNIVTQIQQLISINFNNFALTRTLNEGGGPGFRTGGSDDKILDNYADNADQYGPLEFLCQLHAGFEAGNVHFHIGNVPFYIGNIDF